MQVNSRCVTCITKPCPLFDSSQALWRVLHSHDSRVCAASIDLDFRRLSSRESIREL